MKKTVNLLNSDSKKSSLSNYARAASFISAVTLATFYIVYIAAGANTTIGNNISTSGTLTVGGTAQFSGILNASSTLQATGKATLFGDLEVGTGYLFVSSSTGAIGLGTTSPNAHLHLAGGGDEFILLEYEDGTSNSGLRFKNQTTGLERAALKWNENNNRWDFYVGSSGNTNDIKFQITNTGITASGTLSVLSTSASSTFANGINITKGCFAVNGTCVGGGGTIGNGTQGQVAFYGATGTAVSGTSTLVVATTSRIGIGTSNPLATLDVRGDGIVRTQAEGGSSGVSARVYGSGAIAPGFFGRAARGTEASPTELQSGDNLLVLNGRGWNGTDFSSSANVAITMQAAGTFSGTSNPTQISFATTPTGSTVSQTRLFIGSGGGVGIGTTSPTEQLSVANRLYVGGTGTSTFENNLHVRGTLQTGAGSIYLGDNFVNFNQATSLNFGSTATINLPVNASALTITSPGVNHLFINSNNNRIGINTNNPTFDFDVAYAQTRFKNPSAGNSPTTLQIADNSGTYRANYEIKSGSSFASGGLDPGDVSVQLFSSGKWHVYDGDSFVPRFTVVRTGNVGVGTTSPAAALAVQGNALLSGNLTLANLTATGTIGIGTSTPTESFATNGRIYVGGTGTSTFENNLRVLGDLQVGATSILLRGNATSTFSSGLDISGGCFAINGTCVGGGGGGSGTVGTATLAGQVPFYASASDTLTATSTLFISTASKVGVGTTSPQQALHLTKGSLLQTIETNPAVVGSITDATLLDGAFSVFVSGKFAFVSALNSNRLTIVDVSSTTPVIVSSLNDATNFNGISSVYVSGKYAYVTALTGGRFTVVDITNINAPRVIGSIADATKLAGAQGLYVSGKYAYVTGTTNGYLNIIDISNPTSPTIVGFINNTTQIGQARNVYVSGRYAYIAVENNSRLTIVDISNSTSPTIVASLNDGTNLNGASVVYVSGKYAYVGLNVGTRFTIVDVSNPASPTVVSSLNNSNFNGTKAVQVSGRYAYVSNFGSNLTIVDVFNPNNPVIVGSVSDSTNLNGVRGAHVVGKYAYMVASTGDSLAIVDLPGSEFASANIGLINSNQISVSENIYADNNLHVGNGLNVGSGGIFTRGPLSVYLSSTTQTNAISGFFEGRVGIGTTSPSQSLSVQGATLFSSNVTMSGGQLRIPGGTVTAPGIIIGDPVSGSNQTGIFNPGGTLSFVGDNGVFRWRAAGSGFNNGMMELTAQVSGCPGTGACIHLGNVSGSGTTEVDKVGIYWAAANTLGFLSNGLERGRIDSSGNWGIGTTSPTQKLSVHGNALFSGNLSLANLTATGTLTVQGTGTSTFANGLDISSGCFAINGTCVGGGGGGSGTVNNGTQGQVAFYDATGTAVSGTSSIFIAQNNRIGIGTTNPQNLLSVAGFVDITGPVGIGTTSPTEQLSVANRLYVGGTGTSTFENNLKVLGNLQIGAGTLTLSGDSITSTNSIRFGGGINPNSAPVSSSTSQIITSVVASGYGSGGNDLHDIAIGIDGLPLIAEQENNALVVIKCGNSSCTSGNTKTTVDSSSADIGRFPSIAIGTDGLPIISYYDLTNGDLEVVKCGNISCSSGNTITTVEATNDSGRGTSIAIGADGLPIISFGYFTDFNLKVVKCGNAACSSGNTISVVDGVSGSVGLENSIAIGTDGLPIISYYAVTGDDLKVAKCNNASCSSSTLTTVDTGSGRYNRIAIAGDGLPVISYSVGSTLRMTKCGNISCSSGNTTTDVDTSAASGARTFIAIGIDGLPILAYMDTANDFSVAKCNNATCSSNTQTVIEAGDISLLGQFPKIAIGVDSLPIIAYGGNSSGVLRVVTCANTSCSSTSGTAFTGGQTLGGWISTPRSYSSPYQAVNTVKIINPTAFQNLSLLSGGAERLTITPVGRVGIGTTSPISAFSIHNPAVSSAPSSTTSRAVINLVQDVTGEAPVWAQFGLNGTDANGTNMPAWIGTQVTDSFSIMTASQQRMIIGSNGNVGIGTTSPWRKLSVTGTVGFDGLSAAGITEDALCLSVDKEVQVNTGSATCTVSSKRFKYDIQDSAAGLDIILQLRPVSFKNNGTDEERLGLIAEEVEEIEPRLVVREEDGSPRGVRYEELTSVLAKAIQEQQKQIANLASEYSTFVVEKVKSWLESMKVYVEDGLVRLRDLAAEKVTATLINVLQLKVGTESNPSGITIYDKTTKQPHCIVMDNGQLQSIPGECTSADLTPTTDTTSITTNNQLSGPSQAPPPPPSLQSGSENEGQSEQVKEEEQSEEENSEESVSENSDPADSDQESQSEPEVSDDSASYEGENTSGTTTPAQSE